MKKYEEKQVTRSLLVDHRCDICGADVRTPKGFDFSEANITASIGAIYPEGAFQTHYTLDLCKDCFIDKVKPLIESTFNVEFHEREDD